MHLLVGTIIINFEFNRVQSTEKVLHDMQCYVFVHVDTNLSNLFFQKLYQRSMPDEHICIRTCRH